MGIIPVDTSCPITLEAIEIWGSYGQKAILMEECGELITALAQYNRGRVSNEEVAEEVADVIVSIMSVIPALDMQDSVLYYIQSKIKRLEKRINESKQKTV